LIIGFSRNLIQSAHCEFPDVFAFIIINAIDFLFRICVRNNIEFSIWFSHLIHSIQSFKEVWELLFESSYYEISQQGSSIENSPEASYRVKMLVFVDGTKEVMSAKLWINFVEDSSGFSWTLFHWTISVIYLEKWENEMFRLFGNPREGQQRVHLRSSDKECEDLSKVVGSFLFKALDLRVKDTWDCGKDTRK